MPDEPAGNKAERVTSQENETREMEDASAEAK